MSTILTEVIDPNHRQALLTSTWLYNGDANLGRLPALFTGKFLFFPFHMLFFGSQWLNPAHTQQEGHCYATWRGCIFPGRRGITRILSKADLSLLPHLFIYNHLFISILTQISFYFGVIVKYCQCVSLLIILQLWPLGALLGWFLHSFCTPHFFFLSNSLLSGTLGSSRLILYFLPQIKNQTFLQGAIRPVLNVF